MKNSNKIENIIGSDALPRGMKWQRTKRWVTGECTGLCSLFSTQPINNTRLGAPSVYGFKTHLGYFRLCVLFEN